MLGRDLAVSECRGEPLCPTFQRVVRGREGQRGRRIDRGVPANLDQRHAAGAGFDVLELEVEDNFPIAT